MPAYGDLRGTMPTKQEPAVAARHTAPTGRTIPGGILLVDGKEEVEFSLRCSWSPSLLATAWSADFAGPGGVVAVDSVGTG